MTTHLTTKEPKLVINTSPEIMAAIQKSLRDIQRALPGAELTVVWEGSNCTAAIWLPVKVEDKREG